MILAERAARLSAEAHVKAARASADAMIAHLRLEIEKLRRALYGVRSQRKARLLEQMELQLEELETAAAEDELLAEKAAAKARSARPSPRKRPSRKPRPLLTNAQLNALFPCNANLIAIVTASADLDHAIGRCATHNV